MEKDLGIILSNDGKTILGLEWDMKHSLEKLEIPEGITNIGSNAFYGCALKTVTFPNSLKIIGKCAFANCADLENITFNKGLERIEEGAFRSCESLKQIEFPEGLKDIGDETLEGCEELEAVKLPESLERLGKSVFYGDRELKYLNIPRNVCCMSAETFLQSSFEKIDVDSGNPWFCEKDGIIYSKDMSRLICCINTGLDATVIPDTVKIVGEYAFAAQKKLREVHFTGQLHKLGNNAFFNCFDIEKVTFEKEVTSIGNNCFLACQELKKIELPTGIKEIHYGTFSHSGIKEISLPSTIEYINSDAFRSCSDITIKIGKEKDTLEGVPWGAENANIVWME